MKRFLLTSLITCALAGSALAANDSFVFSYCKPSDKMVLNNLGAIGSSVAQKYGAAIRVDAPYYKNLKLKKIEAYINADAAALRNMSNFQVFLTSTLSPGTPNIMVENVTPQAASLAGDDNSVLSYTFPDGYELDGNAFYAGYYLNVTRAGTVATNYPVLIDKSVKNQPDAFYYYDPVATEGQWSTSEASTGSAIIYLTFSLGDMEFSVNLGEPENAFAEKGNACNVFLPVVNLGTAPVSEIGYSYTLNGRTTLTNTVTIDPALAADPKSPQTLTLPLFPVEEAGNYNVTLNVDQVNGNANQAPSSSVDFTLEVWPYMPKKRPMIEEYTATKCGFCPRGMVAMNYISEEFPDDAVVICYHTDFGGNYDPMIVTAALPFTDNRYQGLPGAALDRSYCLDPYYGSSYYTSTLVNMGVLNDLNTAMKETAFADISFANVEVVDSIITVQTDITFMKKASDNEYRIGYILTCNGLYNPNIRWAQTNYFSHDANYKDAPLLEQFYKGMNTVQGLTFNDVVINASAMSGILNSIPSLEAGGSVTSNYSFDVTDVRNVYNESLNPYLSIDRMVVNAFVIERRTGKVVNARSFPVGKVYNSVQGIGEDGNDATPVYYNLQGQKVENPDKGIYIKVTGNKAEKILR